MERRLLRHLEDKNTITKQQFGFRKRNSVEIALLTSGNDWNSGIEEKKRVDIIFFDFAKAFYKVLLARLVEKIAVVGINHRIIMWIKNFLEDRTF